jgi:MFS family permease
VAVKNRADETPVLLRVLPQHAALRALATVTVVNTFGNGLFLTTSVLYFTKAAELTPSQVGFGLAAAGVCGILAGVPLGRLSDRWGARRALTLLLLIEAIGVVGYTRIRSLALFLLLVCAVTFVDQGATTVRNALIAVVLPPEARVRGRAYLRVVTNVGIGAGSAVAAIALHYDTLETYRTMVLIDAMTFFVAALLLLRLPKDTTLQLPQSRSTDVITPSPDIQASTGRRRALTDRPYLLITTLMGLLSIQVGVLEIGMPLWVAHYTNAPRLIISAVMVVNTTMVIFLQMQASQGTEDLQGAARACLRGGALFAAACVLFGMAHGLPAAIAAAILLVGGAVHTLGEILTSAGGWALSYDLADPTAPGDYQGVFNSGVAAGMLLSPLLITSTAIRFGLAGWLALASMFLATGLACIPATRFALARTAIAQGK